MGIVDARWRMFVRKKPEWWRHATKTQRDAWVREQEAGIGAQMTRNQSVFDIRRPRRRAVS